MQGPTVIVILLLAFSIMFYIRLSSTRLLVVPVDKVDAPRRAHTTGKC